MRWIFLVFLWNISSFQNYREPSKKIPVRNIDFFTIDQFENLYLLNFNELSKMDADRKNILYYSNPLLGNITSLSVLDPLEILLFYRDQSKIIILDNRLSEKLTISLQEFRWRDVQLVSQSDGNHLWLYEQLTDKLYRLNFRTQTITHNSLNISQLLEEAYRPVQIETDLDEVYLNIPQKGIMVFDANGAFKKLLPLPGITYFIHDRDYLYFIRGKNIYSFSLDSNKELNLEIKADDALSLAVHKSRIFVLKKSSIEVYPLLYN